MSSTDVTNQASRVNKKDVVHVYSNIQYYSAIKMNEIMPLVATWMDLERVILSEISPTEKKKYDTASLVWGI